MINRYAGEIHINPIRVLRNDDFNNDGQIKDIDVTLKEAIELNQKIAAQLQHLKAWLAQKKYPGSIEFRFAEGGYIGLKGLPDHQLKELAAQGVIELFDFATDKDWVKKYGSQFGLIWENGRSVEI
jgi:hypothetical protein